LMMVYVRDRKKFFFLFYFVSIAGDFGAYCHAISLMPFG
jgi:hypothetical protein